MQEKQPNYFGHVVWNSQDAERGSLSPEISKFQEIGRVFTWIFWNHGPG